jgi:hypothetical protein
MVLPPAGPRPRVVCACANFTGERWIGSATHPAVTSFLDTGTSARVIRYQFQRRCTMEATWMLALLVGATIVGSALAYGVFTNRQCNAQMRPTKQDKLDEMSWRKELLGD